VATPAFQPNAFQADAFQSGTPVACGFGLPVESAGSAPVSVGFDLPVESDGLKPVSAEFDLPVESAGVQDVQAGFNLPVASSGTVTGAFDLPIQSTGRVAVAFGLPVDSEGIPEDSVAHIFRVLVPLRSSVLHDWNVHAVHLNGVRHVWTTLQALNGAVHVWRVLARTPAGPPDPPNYPDGTGGRTVVSEFAPVVTPTIQRPRAKAELN
jgi:hypothetical protein